MCLEHVRSTMITLVAWVGLIRGAEMARVSHAALQDTILDVARLDVAVFTDPDTSVCTRNAKSHGGCDCNRPFNITSTMMELWGDRLLAVRLVRIGDLMGRARDKRGDGGGGKQCLEFHVVVPPF